MTRSPDEVLRAFARVATNVAIITAPGPAGCTANVWAEAPDPPLLLITLKRGGHTHARVLEDERFAVNVLADHQAALARRFSGPRHRRFQGTRYIAGKLSLPLLEGALASLECSVRAVHWFGAYDIVVGTVEHLAVRDDGRPLLFADAAFHVAQPLEGARESPAPLR